MQIIPFKWGVSEPFLQLLMVWLIRGFPNYSHTVYIISFRHRFLFEISFKNSNDVERRHSTQTKKYCCCWWHCKARFKYFGNYFWLSFESELEWLVLSSLKKLTFNILEFGSGWFGRNLFLWYFNSQFKTSISCLLLF